MTRICQKNLAIRIEQTSIKAVSTEFFMVKTMKEILLTEIVRRGLNNDYKSYIYYLKVPKVILKLYLLSYIHT